MHSSSLGTPPGICLPPNAVLRRVTLNLRASHNCDLTMISPFWPQREGFPDLLDLLWDITIKLPKRRDLLRQPYFHWFHDNPFASSGCMASLKRFASQTGFSETVAGHLALCRRNSRLNCQACWGKFRKWCRDFHHRSSEPTIPMIAEFFTFLFMTKKAAVSTIKGYRAMLSSVFKFRLQEISSSPILKDLVRSFEISAPRPLHHLPPWDLDKVLEYLSGPPF